MKNPIQRIDSDSIKEDSFIDFDVFNNSTSVISIDDSVPEEPKKRKRRSSSSPKDMVKANGETSERDMPMCQSNMPYKDTYNEGEGLLKGSIIQIDELQNSIKEELGNIRASKTLKRKYDYITNLTGSAATLISTKIGAIKEINKITTDSHNLDLKRLKDMNAAHKIDEVDDNKRIMDLYNAYISTPINANVHQLAPSIVDMTFAGSPQGNMGIGLADIGTVEQSQQLSSTHNMMRLEHNPNIKTVIVYDAATGNRWFDVIDITTQTSIPNADKPDSMFLEDIKLDFHNGIGRDTNLDKIYDILVINKESGLLNEY